MKKFRLARAIQFIASFAILLAVCGSAVAADVTMPTKAPPITPAPAIPGWTFILTPYV